MGWKEKYLHTLKAICEKPASDFDAIVEIDPSSYIEKTVNNPNAKPDSVLSYMLDEEKATEEDYKAFCYDAYTYVGLDAYEHLK